MSKVYLVDSEGQVIPMESKPFENEDVMQDFLARCPELLPGEQVNANDPREWLLVAREFGIPIEEGGTDNFSLDHLLLDQDGVPTLIEVKRATDTRVRREVVAQMLDYAANATTYISVESMRSKMAAEYKCSEDEVDAIVAARFKRAPEEIEAYWQMVKTNLQAARIRLVFAADSIPPTLRRMVEFLNSHLDPVEVLALEIKQFQNPDGRRTLVPNVIGQTSEAIDRKQTPGARSTWNESRFFSTLAESNGDSAELGRLLLEWAVRRGLVIKYGTGKVYGSLSICVTNGGKRVPVATLWTGGDASVNFYNLSQVVPFTEVSELQELAGRFNALDGVSIPDDEDTLMRGAPTFRLADVLHEGSPEQLMGVLDWMVDTIQEQE